MSFLTLSWTKRIKVEPSKHEKNGVWFAIAIDTSDGVGIVDVDLTPEQAKEFISLIHGALQSHGGAA